MKFRTPLITQKHDTPGEFVLYQDFVIEFEHAGFRLQEVIPKGFITDFASVPRVAQILPGFGVAEASAKSAVAHDYHYCCRGRLAVTDLQSGDITRLTLTRQQCDRLLYDGLLTSGYSRAIAGVFYAAVRIGGWIYWNRRANGLRPDFDFVPLDYTWSKP